MGFLRSRLWGSASGRCEGRRPWFGWGGWLHSLAWWVALLLLWQVLPAFFALWLLLLDRFSFLGSSQFDGLGNYEILLRDPLFWKAMGNTPIWIPERLMVPNWQAAWGLGAQTGSSWWGGFGPGQSVTLRLYTPPGPAPQVTVPSPPGAFSDPRSERTRIEVANQGDHRAIRFTNESNERFRTLPAVILISKEYPSYTPALPPDAIRSSGDYWRLEFVNVAPGLLGYIFHNYLEAWYVAPFARYFFNSFFTAGLQVLGGLFLAALAAFALARIPFPGQRWVFGLILATLMIPGEVLLIPNYLLLARLEWIDTYYALIVPWLASVFGIFLLRQFYLSLPQDLFDAARIGCEALDCVLSILVNIFTIITVCE